MPTLGGVSDTIHYAIAKMLTGRARDIGRVSFWIPLKESSRRMDCAIVTACILMEARIAASQWAALPGLDLSGIGLSIGQSILGRSKL